MDTLDCIRYEIQEAKKNAALSGAPTCCAIAYTTAFNQALDIIDGYSNRENTQEATDVPSKARPGSIQG